VIQEDLYGNVMMVLQTSCDPLLLENAWSLVGFLCSGFYNPEHAQNFIVNKCVNLLNLIDRTIKLDKIQPKILKNVLFTLSNIVADRSDYFEMAINLHIFERLTLISEQVIYHQ